VVTDNHLVFYVYIHTVSPVRQQFFRLAQTLIRNTIISPLKSSSGYACILNTSKLRYSCITPPLNTSLEILIDLVGLALLHSIRV